MLTAAGSSLATARINGHVCFHNVLGSITPVDPPIIEQTVACLGNPFKKWRVHKRCLIFPFGGMTLWSAMEIHKFATTNRPTPKYSRKWQSSVPTDPIGQPALFWMSFPPKRKSLAVGSDILFYLVLLSSMCRVGGWRSKSEWREEGMGTGDHNVLCCPAKRELKGWEELDACEHVEKCLQFPSLGIWWVNFLQNIPGYSILWILYVSLSLVHPTSNLDMT